MIDVAFPVEGDTLPGDYRFALAEALDRALPWLADTPAAGVHRLNLVRNGGNDAIVSRRTRLALRVPRKRAADAGALAGAELSVAGHRLRLGAAQQRELRHHATLFAHVVAGGDDELLFMQAVNAELESLGVQCRAMCGLRHLLEGGRLAGYSLMLDGLSPHQSLTMLEAGVGGHRRLGCGLFVGHKSAAAVGAPE
ncbi:MAG: CRISPR-associated protein Cas6-related protein [Ramlibacter sp.]|jgi:CRISPR-associated protein Cas6|nr:CRISPR-associated protein Cas6-related protein [Ramlibacter sp.]